MNVVTVNPIQDPRWLRFIEGREDAVIFHHPAWLALLAKAYGYTPMAQVLVENEEIIGGLPLAEIRSSLTGSRAVALPFCDFCPPLVSSSEALGEIIRSLSELRESRRWKYVELRDAVVHHDLHPSAEYRAHILTLDSDPDTVFKSFKKTQTQQSIFRATREGVRVERRTDERALRDFIRLNAVTRRRHGVPPQPDSFLRLLREMVLEPGHGFINLAIYNGSVIGSAVFLHFGRTVVYKYGASTEESLNLRPNHAVMWEAIRWAIEQGYRQFHFGRSDISNEGLIRYKRGWGTEESALSYVRLGELERRGRSEGKMSAMIHAAVGRTPIPILKAVGRMLYRHVG